MRENQGRDEGDIKGEVCVENKDVSQIKCPVKRRRKAAMSGPDRRVAHPLRHSGGSADITK